MEITSRASEYVFQGNTGYAPNITLNVSNPSVTAEMVDSAIAEYDQNAENYAQSFRVAVANREYIKERFMNDLCRETFLTEGGDANLQSNTIALHNKADDVYNLAAAGRTATSVSTINGISSSFNEIYSAVCLDDSKTSTSLVADFASPETYDDQAVTVTTLTEDAFEGIYIKDVPNAIGNAQTFTNYETTVDASNNVTNTPKYTLAYNSAYAVASGVTSAVWMISSDSAAVAYTTSLLEQTVENGAITNGFQPDAEWVPVIEAGA